MGNGLRLMIYDQTDIKGWTKQLKKYTPIAIDDLIDDWDIQLGLTHTWMAGGWFYRLFGRFDHVKGFSSWEDALKWLCEIEPEKTIAEIQFWGHGSPGTVWLNGGTLHRSSFSSPDNGPWLSRLKARLTGDSLIWFRCCSIFAADRGQEFAVRWADEMGCRIAAHTYIIHLIQSGLYCIGPGQKPWWSPAEGIEGTADRPTGLLWGKPWTSRSILATRSTLPKWAQKA